LEWNKKWEVTTYMAKGYGGMQGGMNMNMNNLMKQAQKMQKQMAEMQAGMAEKTLEVSSGGGAVKVLINGEKQIQSLTISPDVVDRDDVEMLQDLVMTAVNEAILQMDELVSGQMSRLTGGMGMPGLF
jgi:DNA-binding YbaB/EbfC family protein